LEKAAWWKLIAIPYGGMPFYAERIAPLDCNICDYRFEMSEVSNGAAGLSV
jgi:hypothetical protein